MGAFFTIFFVKFNLFSFIQLMNANERAKTAVLISSSSSEFEYDRIHKDDKKSEAKKKAKKAIMNDTSDEWEGRSRKKAENPGEHFLNPRLGSGLFFKKKFCHRKEGLGGDVKNQVVTSSVIKEAGFTMNKRLNVQLKEDNMSHLLGDKIA